MPDFYIGDYGQVITLDLIESAAALDLTSAVITLTMEKPSEAVIVTSAEVTSVTGGEAVYSIPQGLLDEAGLWRNKVSSQFPTKRMQGRFTMEVEE